MNNKNNKVVYVYIPNKLNLKFIFLLFSITLTITSCGLFETHKGSFGIGVPIALNPSNTKASLDSQKKVVTKQEDVAQINPFGTNQGYFLSSNQSQSGKVTYAPPGATAPSAPQKDVSSADEIIPFNEPKDYTGLVMDGFTSLESFSAHKVDMEEDFDYSIMSKVKDGELYKVKFNLWVEPERQDYETYLWRWAPALFSHQGFKNYTKDYHAEIKFTLETTEAEIILVQPVNEGINSREGVLMQQTSQLAGGASWQGIAAEIDLAERHREQFTEQRKNPILRGIVNSPKEFRFIISPRQYVEQRVFRVPFFMSRYSLERGLEYGPYPVSAYVAIKKTAKDVDEIKISVCGHYKKFGNAHKNKDDDEINYIGSKKACKNDFVISLQKDDSKKPDVPVVTVSKYKPHKIDLSWGGRVITPNIACAATNKNTATVKLIYLEPSLRRARLVQGAGIYKNDFWIKTSARRKARHGKAFILEFCSSDGGVKKTIQTKSIKYVADQPYQFRVSFNNNFVTSSTSGRQVKIRILGGLGEKIKIKGNTIKFGNMDASISADSNAADNIIDFNVIIPDVKDKRDVSITATIENEVSPGEIIDIPITIIQTFTIKKAI